MANNTYRIISVPGHPMAYRTGKAYEHRVVAYDLGLLTGPEDRRHVHHRNGDTRDNRPENLEVLDPSHHLSHHNPAPEFCHRGHRNWYVRPDGKGKICRTCTLDRQRKRFNRVPRGEEETCRRGHPWTVENTYYRPDTGTRICRACSSMREARRPKRRYVARYNPEQRHAAYLRRKERGRNLGAVH